jgi:hypothetical protein
MYIRPTFLREATLLSEATLESAQLTYTNVRLTHPVHKSRKD